MSECIRRGSLVIKETLVLIIINHDPFEAKLYSFGVGVER